MTSKHIIKVRLSSFCLLEDSLFLYLRKVKLFILHLNNLYPLLLAKFQTKILQSEFLNLATARHREFIHKEDIFGDFITRDFISAEVTHIFFLHCHTFFQNDKCTDGLSVFL